MSPSRSRKRRQRKNKSNRKIILIVALLAVAVTIIVGYYMLGNNNPNENVPNGNTTSQMKVLFETSMGNVIIQLRDDRPITTDNFKNLTLNGVYDNTIFHRVISNFMIQGGDYPNIPTILDEGLLSDNNRNDRGTIAMANRGANTGTSQFFINVVDNNLLDKPNPEMGISGHPVFGEVIQGMNVVDAISLVLTDGDPPAGNNKPLEDVVLIRATLIE